MRADSRGLKLFAVRRREDVHAAERNHDTGDLATFFASVSAVRSLLTSLDKYEAWIDGAQGEIVIDDDGDDNDDDDIKRPRRFWLFEGTEQFRVATIEDLWADDPDRLPRENETVEWEVWLRPGFEAIFTTEAESVGIPITGQPTKFPDTTLVNVRANKDQLAALVRATAAVVELRGASTFVADYLDLIPEARAALVGQLGARLVAPPADAPRTTILDTGVNHAHPLLNPMLPRSRCHSVEPGWGTADHDGHGTKSAGIVAFGGGLEALLAEGAKGAPVQLTTALESVTVISPEGGARIPARDAIVRAVSIVERTPHPRVFCLAGTADGEAETGRQTSTSAALDKLAWGDGEATRLFCVAAGNVATSPEAPYRHAQYGARNADHRIQAPGQALNALTVGAHTDKTAEGLRLVAPLGDMSPTARTAIGWTRRYAHKPDIVMEGGNHAMDDDGIHSRPSHPLMVLTTHRNAPRAPLGLTNETSAATAYAAGLVTRLLAQYPGYRMETLRALMVHAAEWTPAMQELYDISMRLSETRGREEAWARVLSCYGWGVPSEERLVRSASNALTLVVEDELTPYLKRDGRIVLNQMKYFRLPWPVRALRDLNQTEVEMRCTLSYFTDPHPLADSRDRRDRYASHSLRFDLRRFGESQEAAQRRVNELAEENLGDVNTGAPDDGWVVGPAMRRRGSLHHDIWKGAAFRLASRDGISVYPVRGWWGDRPSEDYHTKSTRFSLVVSIRTPPSAVDLVAEAVNLIPNHLLVENLVRV
ncbi:S8 family peptidase [Methylobacterium sp. J-059]|uniref:S8 family peptidase n=1 Tax=Methylobacterium sp. J-059 TaxID=2836643 RepID=UPI001FBB755B|nr:S8 family peptidase [Methylobacterium sp. J-059]MCJ2041037.1 S8 family peptidase [Methylobacterium sp. J-059]